MTQNELAYQANKIKEAEMETGRKRADIESRKTDIMRDEYQLKKDRQGWDIAANMIGSIGSAVGSVTGAIANPIGRVASANVSNAGNLAVAQLKSKKGGK